MRETRIAIRRYAVTVRAWSPSTQTECRRYVHRRDDGICWLTPNVDYARTWLTRRGAARWAAKHADLGAEVVPVSIVRAAYSVVPDLTALWHRAEILAAQAS